MPGEGVYWACNAVAAKTASNSVWRSLFFIGGNLLEWRVWVISLWLYQSLMAEVLSLAKSGHGSHFVSETRRVDHFHHLAGLVELLEHFVDVLQCIAGASRYACPAA